MENSNVEFQIDLRNKRCYGSYHAVRNYAKSSGWLDSGEKLALSYAVITTPPGNLLDIGVGGGRTIPLMTQWGHKYVGIDYVPALINRAKKRYPTSDLREMDARNLMFDDDTFGLVTFSFNGIDSVGEAGRLQVLNEVHRVLQPNGYFVFSALNHYGTSDRQLRLKPRWSELVSPKNLLLWPIKFTMRYVNILQSKKIAHEGKNYSRRVVAAHEYGLIGRYTSFSRQCDELERNGFIVEKCFTSFGEEITNRNETLEHVPYIHYVARKIPN